MPGIFSGQSFAFEYMPKVGVAILAHDLCASAIAIPVALDGTFNLIVETRPAAMRIKFVIRLVQRRIASSADIRAARLIR